MRRIKGTQRSERGRRRERYQGIDQTRVVRLTVVVGEDMHCHSLVKGIQKCCEDWESLKHQLIPHPLSLSLSLDTIPSSLFLPLPLPLPYLSSLLCGRAAISGVGCPRAVAPAVEAWDPNANHLSRTLQTNEKGREREGEGEERESRGRGEGEGRERGGRGRGRGRPRVAKIQINKIIKK